jgi:hypothetical protein
MIPTEKGMYRHHYDQWEKTDRAHWWRRNWDRGGTFCKFCGEKAPEAEGRDWKEPNQEAKQ